MAFNLGSFGAFLGGNNGTPGLAQQIQAAQAQALKQKQQRLAQQSIMQALATSQGSSSPNIPGSSPIPAGAGMPPLVSAPANGQPAPIQAGAAATGSAPNMNAPPDHSAVIKAVMASPMDPADKKEYVTNLMALDVEAKRGWYQQQELKYKDLHEQIESRRADTQDRRADTADRAQAERERNDKAKEDAVAAKEAATIKARYAAMNASNLRTTLTQLTQQLDNNPKLSNEDRAALNTQWQAASDALNDKRKSNGLEGPHSLKMPTGPDDAATTVTVTSPDGQVGTIPASQLQDALAAGYKQK